MIINKRTSKIVVILVLIVSFLQVFRVGSLTHFTDLVNKPKYVYSLEESEVLSDDLKNELSQHRVLFIPSDDGPVNEVYLKLLNYLKLEVDIMEDLGETAYDLNSYDIVLCSDENWSTIALFDDILEYAQAGGGVIINHGIDSVDDEDYRLFSKKIGIVESGKEYEIRALEFYKAILPGIEKLEAKDESERFWTYTTEVQVSEDSEIYLVDGKKNPLLWRKKIGKGYIGVCNAEIYDLELRKALTLGLMENVQDNFVYPIIDSQVIFIDDFPAEFNGYNKRVVKEFGLNTKRFLAEVWWPDMVSTIFKFDTIYTAAFVSGYNDNVEGDFEDEQLISEKTLIRYGREIFRYYGEAALHGYNHQSLVFDQEISDRYGYKAWSDNETIKKALKVARDRFSESYPNYAWKVYVPPSNVFDKKALDALVEEIPSIEVLAGVIYSDSPGVLVQDFTVDDRGIIQLPRVSSGTNVTDFNMLNILSVAKTNGIVNHFIHPDDFLDDARGGDKTWKEMFREYNKFLSTLEKTYPWMSKDKASDAGQKVKQYHYMELYSKVYDDKIVIACDNFQIDQSLILVTNKNIISAEGGTVKKLVDGRYMIMMHKNIVNLEVE